MRIIRKEAISEELKLSGDDLASTAVLIPNDEEYDQVSIEAESSNSEEREKTFLNEDPIIIGFDEPQKQTDMYNIVLKHLNSILEQESFANGSSISVLEFGGDRQDFLNAISKDESSAKFNIQYASVSFNPAFFESGNYHGWGDSTPLTKDNVKQTIREGLPFGKVDFVVDIFSARLTPDVLYPSNADNYSKFNNLNWIIENLYYQPYIGKGIITIFPKQYYEVNEIFSYLASVNIEVESDKSIFILSEGDYITLIIK